MWIPNPTNAGRLAQAPFEIPQMDFNLTLPRTRTRKRRLRRRVERERDILKKLYPLSARRAEAEPFQAFSPTDFAEDPN